jgi:hypothetical protein
MAIGTAYFQLGFGSQNLLTTAEIQDFGGQNLFTKNNCLLFVLKISCDGEAA